MQNDSYNRGGYLAFLFSMCFSLAFFVYIVAVHPGVNLKEVPEPAAATGGPEQTIAAVDVSKVEKPWVENKDMADHGAKVFANNCAVCHGTGGLGDGAAGKGLNPPPRNLVEGKWKAGGDSVALYKTLTNGLAGTSMAAFGHLSSTDRWALVQFIRSITKNAGKDDPAAVEAFAKTAK